MTKISIGLLSSTLLLVSALPCFPQLDEDSETAWDVLIRVDPAAASDATAAERRILQVMTAEQADDLAHGVDPASLRLADGRTVADFLKGIVVFDLSWWTVDGGGGTSTGGSFRLSGTIGQADGTTLSGDGFVLHGGFWGESPVLLTDGFETGNTANWISTFGGF